MDKSPEDSDEITQRLAAEDVKFSGQMSLYWDNPDFLYQILLSQMGNRPVPSARRAAERLGQIDSNPERAAVTLSIILMQSGDIMEAHRVLIEHLAHHPESAVVLVNLAKTKMERNQDPINSDEQTMDLVRRAVDLDPNFNPGFWWFTRWLMNMKGAETCQREMLRIAARPDAWLAELQLARMALAGGNKSDVLTHVNQALAKVPPTEVNADFMILGTEILGRAGFFKECLTSLYSRYQPKKHGAAPAGNLIQCALSMGDRHLATFIRDEIASINEPDFVETVRKFSSI